MTSRPLTTGETAAYCRVSLRTVLRWIKRGDLEAYQLPGRGDNRVEAASLVRFLRSHAMPVPRDLAAVVASGDGASGGPVLIVDHDEASAQAIQRVLGRAGFETVVATDGFRAGALLEATAPPVMTLDLAMPGLGGIDAIRFVRDADRLNRTRILVVSAPGWQELDRALQSGADDILTKPFDNAVLVTKVEALYPGPRAAPREAAVKALTEGAAGRDSPFTP